MSFSKVCLILRGLGLINKLKESANFERLRRYYFRHHIWALEMTKKWPLFVGFWGGSLVAWSFLPYIASFLILGSLGVISWTNGLIPVLVLMLLFVPLFWRTIVDASEVGVIGLHLMFGRDYAADAALEKLQCQLEEI